MHTLGLSIIVSDEVFEIDRCLKSVTQGSLFDEIVVTMTVNNVEVESVIKKYTDKIYFFEWIKDFSAARNFCLDKMTTDFVLWLDSDDIITLQNFQKLQELKSTINDHDVYMITYNYFHDNQGRPYIIQPRERIFRRIDSLRWHGAIHEVLLCNVMHKICQRRDIAIDHYRIKPFNALRNIEILRHQFELHPDDARYHFYLGRDIVEEGLFGKPELLNEGYSILEAFLKKNYGFSEDRVMACLKLAQCYLAKGDFETAKNYALQGMTISDKYAELYLVLGEVYRALGNYDLAIQYNEEALTRNLDAGFAQMPEQYKLKPATNLSLLYYWNKGDKDKSFQYNRIALQCDPNNANFLYNQKVLLTEMSTKISVIWFVPTFNTQNPVVRIRYYNSHLALITLNIRSMIVTAYYHLSINQIVQETANNAVFVFTQKSDFDIKLATALKAAGKKVVIDVCESLFYNAGDLNNINAFDMVTCCSTYLSQELKTYGINKTRVIKDAIEDRPVEHNYENNDQLKAVYAGMGGNSFLVTDVLKDIIESAGYELVVISEWDNATKKWDMNTWHEEMNKCDVSLCPQRVDIQPAKSNVKVTTAMSLGLPVIASPILAYKEIISHGENGYLCETKHDWYKALIELKSGQIRKQVGERGKSSISHYTSVAIINEWIGLFYDILHQESKSESSVITDIKVRTPVDIIILNYNNLDYLKLCISSILLNTDYPYHIIISDAGSSDKEVWDYFSVLKGFTIIGSSNIRLNFSQACNAAMSVSRSKYFVILNSDVIVSKGWLNNLVEKLGTVPRLAACGVLSNCDRGWLHGIEGRPFYQMRTTKGIELVPGMTKEQIDVDDLYQFMESSNKNLKGTFIEQEWIAAYATIFVRSAINEIGGFDEEYKNGCEDRDICIRLKKYHYVIGQAIDSFVYHFGGISRGAYEKECYDVFHEEDVYNHNRMFNKWAKEKIVIYTGPAWEKWDKNTVNKGMGGSETWAARLAEQFSILGYDVTVYNDMADMNATVVESTSERYRHYSKVIDDFKCDCIDYFIASRTTDIFSIPYLHAINKYVMIHDIWLSQDPNYNIQEWQIDKYMVLSDWHKSYVMQHHKIPEKKIVFTANGSDQQLYENADNVQKNNKIFYSSSPDRGLYELLQMFPKIREKVPNLELVVAYGFYNWEQAIKQRGNENELTYCNAIKQLLNQPGIKFIGRVSKEELAEEQMQCKAWLYPTAFWETFCISSVEAGLAKCAILSTKLAGLITTVGDSGILIDGDNKSNTYQEKFIEESIKLLTNEEYRLAWAKKAYDKMKQYRWDVIAKDWKHIFDARQIKCLNLGCNDLYISGFINIDINTNIKTDLNYDIRRLKEKFEYSSIDFIYAGHIINCLSFNEAVQVMKDCHDILKYKHDIIVVVPDYEYCMKNCLVEEASQILLNNGNCKDIYDEQRLKKLFQLACFQNITRMSLLDVPYIFKVITNGETQIQPWQIAVKGSKL